MRPAPGKGDLQAKPLGGVDDEPDDQGLCRSRRGLTTKVHLTCEQRQKPLAVVITGGQRGDSPQFPAVLEGIRVPRPGGGHPHPPDKLAVRYEATIHIAAISEWLRSYFLNTP